VSEVLLANRQPLHKPHAQPTNDVSDMSAPTSEPLRCANEVCPQSMLHAHDVGHRAHIDKKLGGGAGQTLAISMKQHSTTTATERAHDAGSHPQ